MPRSTAASAAPAAESVPAAGRARTLTQVYRRFGEGDAAAASPLSAQVAIALSESPEALRTIEGVPARKRHPTVILAALHDLALAGKAPTLAQAYHAGNGGAAAAAAVATLTSMGAEVAALAVRRPVRSDETGRCAVLYPAIAEAARQVGAEAVGLIDVGCGAGLNLNVDRVAIAYSNGQVLGDPSSPVRMTGTIVGDRPVPSRALPRVITRIGIDTDPLDVTDEDDARWLRACLWPDRPDRPDQPGRPGRPDQPDQRAARLEAEMALAAGDPPRLLDGEPVSLLPEALALVPAHVLPVVTTTWALARFSLETRLKFLHRLDEAATHRPVAWVSAEGVGVAPTIPTLGDRRASGHSIIGLAVLEHSAMRSQALGRSWSQGRMLTWLAGN